MDKWLETWYGWPVWPSSSAYIFHMILEFWWEHISVMCSHLVPPSCLCLCTPHQLCICFYISLLPLHLCCIHIPKSIQFSSSTMVHLIPFIYHSPSHSFCWSQSTSIFTVFGHTHLTLSFSLSHYIK